VIFLFILPAHSGAPSILVLGDSLSAAYGVNVRNGWVTLLQEYLTRNDFPYHVVNASISGETTYGGLSRLPAALKRHRPALVIVELGANDALRGQSLDRMRSNLATIIEAAQEEGAKVLLLGMRIPPNYGPSYTKKFWSIYKELSETYQVPLVPFMLENVAGNPALTLEDGLHPRAEAQPIILDNIWPYLEPLLRKAVERAEGNSVSATDSSNRMPPHESSISFR
jgi:Lysophospholipase L1 and related esterases